MAIMASGRYAAKFMSEKGAFHVNKSISRVRMFVFAAVGKMI